MLGIHLLPIALPDSSVIVDDYYFAAARWPATARVAQSAAAQKRASAWPPWWRGFLTRGAVGPAAYDGSVV